MFKLKREKSTFQFLVPIPTDTTAEAHYRTNFNELLRLRRLNLVCLRKIIHHYSFQVVIFARNYRRLKFSSDIGPSNGSNKMTMLFDMVRDFCRSRFVNQPQTSSNCVFSPTKTNPNHR